MSSTVRRVSETATPKTTTRSLLAAMHRAEREEAKWLARAARARMARDEAIRAMTRPPLSMSYRAVAAETGLSFQRVSQIVKEES